MATRRRERDAVEAFVAATRSLDLETRIGPTTGPHVDLAIVFPEGQVIVTEVKTSSLVTGDSAPIASRKVDGASAEISLVVADRITAAGRERLNREGLSWLDLRGHLRLVGPGLFVDADVPPVEKAVPVRRGLTGDVVLELASLLLLEPGSRLGVREAATSLSRAPSSVSKAFSTLRELGLVDADRSPAVPELFWELAAHWRSEPVDVATAPTIGDHRGDAVLGMGLDDVESTVGWALTDTVAAARYGAPVSMRVDHPPDFFVPDLATQRRAVRLLGLAASPAVRAARVKIAPVPLVCARRVGEAQPGYVRWPMAHPLFVALDLAQDPGRGREIVEAWQLDGPWHRVW